MTQQTPKTPQSPTAPTTPKMPQITLLAAVDKNWAIGYKGNLLFRLPLDMRRFRQMTTGSTVIYGRRTLESFPGGKALPNRVNIVLTSDASRVQNSGALAAAGVEDALMIAAAQGTDEIFVIGGETIYRQFLPFATAAQLTQVDAAAENADAFFPNLNAPGSGWHIAAATDPIDDNGYTTRYLTYQCISEAK